MSDKEIAQLDEKLLAEHRRDFDGEDYPCGYYDYCDYCDCEDENFPCAKAKLRMESEGT